MWNPWVVDKPTRAIVESSVVTVGSMESVALEDHSGIHRINEASQRVIMESWAVNAESVESVEYVW